MIAEHASILLWTQRKKSRNELQPPLVWLPLFGRHQSTLPSESSPIGRWEHASRLHISVSQLPGTYTIGEDDSHPRWVCNDERGFEKSNFL